MDYLRRNRCKFQNNVGITGSYNEEYRHMEYRVFDIPHDADDFSRCYKFFKLCNLSDEQLQKVKGIFPVWEPYIDNWYELVRLYENTEPMYEYMCTLIDKSVSIKRKEYVIDKNY
jgi:hypothetical protein